MKQNKLTLMTVALLGGIIAFAPVLSVRADDAAPAASANAPAGKHAGHVNKIKELIQSFNLPPDKASQVRNAMKSMSEQMKEMKDDTALDADAKRAKVKSILDGTLAKIKPALSEDQFAKLETTLKQMHTRAGAGGNHASAGTKPLPTTPQN